MDTEEYVEDYENFQNEYGEDAEYEKDAKYNEAFEEKTETSSDEDVEYELDEVVGARDKKPIMSKLNQRELDKYEMDDLFNQI